MLKHWAARPRGIRWLAGIAAVVLGLAIAWALFVPLADWLAHHDVGSATGPLHETALNDARGRLLTLGAGLVAAAALVFTALNFALLRRNSEQADQWQRRTHELTEQGQVTDRYTKAIEQLGSDKLDVRIGGIYALERIARDSARDHPAVMAVLTAFIREHSWEPWPLPRTEEEEDAGLVEFMRPDIQAALAVVGGRDAKRDVQLIDLARADLRRAKLNDTDLSLAILSAADLSGANLISARLVATWFDRADLSKAVLYSADLTDASLTGTRLVGADLRMTKLTHARLFGADLTGADLFRADLFGAGLTDADLTRARWPRDAPVPDGWELEAGSGLLQRAGTDAEPAEPT